MAFSLTRTVLRLGAPLLLRPLLRVGAKAAIATAATTAVALGARAAIRSVRRYDLRGRVVLITGASRGLGLAMARQLAKRGAKLAICGRHADTLEQARAELASMGAEVLAEVCDVTKADQVERFVAHVNEQLGAVDVVIANAATIRVGPHEAMGKEDFSAALDDIFWGAYHVTEAALPAMRRRKHGRIVHISSIGGRVPVPHLGPYTTAKFALTGYSEGLRAELAQDGVKVTTVAPGLMRTGSHVRAQFKGNASREFSWFALSVVLPVASIAADRAAASIIDALEQGESQVTLSLPAKLMSLAHGLAPGLFTDAMGLVNRLALPSASGHQEEAPVEGRDVQDDAIGSSIIEAAGRADVARFHQNNAPAAE